MAESNPLVPLRRFRAGLGSTWDPARDFSLSRVTDTPLSSQPIKRPGYYFPPYGSSATLHSFPVLFSSPVRWLTRTNPRGRIISPLGTVHLNFRSIKPRDVDRVPLPVSGHAGALTPHCINLIHFPRDFSIRGEMKSLDRSCLQITKRCFRVCVTGDQSYKAASEKKKKERKKIQIKVKRKQRATKWRIER